MGLAGEGRTASEGLQNICDTRAQGEKRQEKWALKRKRLLRWLTGRSVTV